MTTSPGYSDQPATQDELGFAPFAAALAAISQDVALADTPLTIGIYGPWGSGKTSMMRMILDRLDQAMLEGIATRDAEGFSVLTPPEDLEKARMIRGDHIKAEVFRGLDPKPWKTLDLTAPLDG